MRLHLLAVLVLVTPLARAQSVVYRLDTVERFATSVDDIDHDGYSDLLVSHAPNSGNFSRVDLISARTGAVLRSHATGVSNDSFGWRLADLGDVDQDGVGDYAISATYPFAHHVAVYSGNTGALLYDVVPSGPLSTHKSFGRELAARGDVDGDGVGDLLIGSPCFSCSEGEAYLISGRTGATIRVHRAPNVQPAEGMFGFSVAMLGDVDHDGACDYAIGDPQRLTPLWGPGKVTVFSGASGAALLVVQGSSLSGFGWSLDAVGDIDGDGTSELLVGAPFPVTHPPLGAGRASVISCATGYVIGNLVGEPTGLSFGASVTRMGDQDRDGTNDFAVLTPNSVGHGGSVWGRGAVTIFSGATMNAITTYGVGGPVVTAEGPIVALDDLDHDGRRDLAVCYIGTNAPTRWIDVVLTDAPSPVPYCSAQANSLGCVPALAASGAASSSIGPGATAAATNFPSQKSAFVFWGTAPAALPFGDRTLCVAPPRVRTPLASTAGNVALDCSGRIEFTFTGAYLAAYALAPGTEVFAQAWSRDGGFAPPQNFALTNGVRLTVSP